MLRWIVLLAISVLPLLARKPNIVLILADDLGYAELSCQGARDLPTPRIDSIAASGVRFTDGYVTAAYCCPSRAGLITGRYQTRFGHELNAIGIQNFDEHVGLPLSETTIAEVLAAEGYATALIGKWHLGAHEKRRPLRRGFDEFFGFLNEGRYYVPKPYHGVTTWLRIAKNPEGPGPRLRRGRFVFSDHMGYDEPLYDLENPVWRGGQETAEREYLTGAFAREAVGFIERRKSEPFFLYLSFSAPHSPMQAADAYMERFRHIEDIHRRIFVAMVAHMDDAVGEVLAKLREEGLEDNTLVFFLSDNGGPTRELTSSNEPLRDGKGQLYEGGVRVPFLIQWKGTLNGGCTYTRPVSSLDILPTALAAAGVAFEPAKPLDGVNLLPYLQGDAHGDPHESLFWRQGQRIALRQGDWKVVGQFDWNTGVSGLELYNLEGDLSEERDLAGTDPERLARLREEIERLNREMTEPRWYGDPRVRPTRTNVPLELLEDAP